ETNGAANPRQPTRATVVVSSLLRYILCFCCGRCRTRRSRFFDETVSSGERRSPCGRVAGRSILNFLHGSLTPVLFRGVEIHLSHAVEKSNEVAQNAEAPLASRVCLPSMLRQET